MKTPKLLPEKGNGVVRAVGYALDTRLVTSEIIAWSDVEN